VSIGSALQLSANTTNPNAAVSVNLTGGNVQFATVSARIIGAGFCTEEVERRAVTHTCQYSSGVTLQGSIEAVNASLQGLTFFPAAANQDVTLTATLVTVAEATIPDADGSNSIRVKSTSPAKQTWTGVVKDAKCLTELDSNGQNTCWQENMVLSGVALTASQAIDGTTASTVTAADGTFSIELPVSVQSVNKVATLDFSKSTYKLNSVRSEMFPGMSTNLQDVYIFPVAAPTSLIKGKVVDTQKNNALPATVALIDSTGSVIQTVTAAASSGEFTFNSVLSGIYSIKGSATGFMDNTVAEVAYNAEGVLVALSPALEHPGDIRAVLLWGKSGPAPNDMDLHTEFIVTREGASQGSKCSVTWNRLKCSGASYDIDNMQGGQYGTETITLGEMQPTVYTLYVNNYQSLAATELAQVRVDIMGNTGTLMTVREPQASDTSVYKTPPSAFDGKYRPESKYLRIACIDTRNPEQVVVRQALQYTKDPPELLTNCTGFA